HAGDLLQARGGVAYRSDPGRGQPPPGRPRRGALSTGPGTFGLILRGLRPPIGDRRFWVVQGLVLLIAIVHEAIDLTRVLSPFSGADIVPVALFLIPVVYAALNFGLTGSFATAALVSVLTVPDTLLVP